MNKKYQKPKQLSYKSIIFWSIIAVITIIFLIVMVVKFAQSRTVNSYSSLKQVSGEQVFSQKDDTYLVFVYNSYDENSATKDEFDQLMFNYITFAKRYAKNNDDVFAIYGLNVNKPENSRAIVSGDNVSESIRGINKFENLKISKNNVPLLLIIKDGAVSDYKATNSDIGDYLQNIMENK